MGYYVSGYSNNFRLRAGQDKAIMDQMRELNKRDDMLKRTRRIGE